MGSVRIRRTVAVTMAGVAAGATIGAGTANAAPAAGKVSMASGRVTFVAGNGVENRLSVAVAGQVLTITDSAASVTVVSGEAGTCDSIGIRTIRCENAAEVRLELGDYGDQATILSTRTVKVYAGTGDDTVTADDSTGDFTVYGNAGNDTVKTGDGEDYLSGGDGNDHLVAGDGKDTVRGNAGDDQVWGGHGDDQVEGHSGNDKAYGGPGNDNVNGGTGNDTVYGDQGNDLVYGWEGDDWGYGGPGTDFVSMGDSVGFGSDQRAYGGDGYDYCTGERMTSHDCESA